MNWVPMGVRVSSWRKSSEESQGPPSERHLYHPIASTERDRGSRFATYGLPNSGPNSGFGTPARELTPFIYYKLPIEGKCPILCCGIRMAHDTQSGRIANRFLAGLSASMHYRGLDYDCVVETLSRTGLLLVGDLPWPEESEVRAAVMSTATDLRLEFSGRVAHVFRDEANRRTRVGLEFNELTDRQRQTLAALTARVVEGLTPAPLQRLGQAASLKEIRAALDEIAIPHRIALALRAQLTDRRFLLHDTNLQVLESLARNPTISQMEIKKLARMPQLLPTTIEFIAGDRRWADDEELQIVLATHPRVNVLVAEPIVEKMTIQSLRKVVRAPGLNPILRQKLLNTISERELRGW